MHFIVPTSCQALQKSSMKVDFHLKKERKIVHFDIMVTLMSPLN